MFCMVFATIWWIAGIACLLVGLYAPPLYTEGTDPYEQSKDNIYNTKIAGFVIVPISSLWCIGMCLLFCKDSMDFKKLQADRIAEVNRQYEADQAALRAQERGVNSPGSNNDATIIPQIVVTPVPVPVQVPYNVGHFCRICGTARQGLYDSHCVKCGASLTEGVPTGNIHSVTYPATSSSGDETQSLAPNRGNITVNVQVGRHSPRGSANDLPPAFNDATRPNNPYGVPNY